METIAQIDWGAELAVWFALGLLALVSAIVFTLIRKALPKRVNTVIDGVLGAGTAPVSNHDDGVPDFPEERISKFAQTATAIDKVLAIRASYFAGAAPSSDDAYVNSLAINNQVFKVVYCDGEEVGFWGVLPISQATFEAFCAGHLTHQEMLEQGVISWEAAGQAEGLHLYFTGLVKVAGTRGVSLLLDAFAFFKELSSEHRVSGIACYAERDKGASLIRKRLLTAGFHKTGATQGLTKPNPIVACTGGGIAKFVQSAASWMDREPGSVPDWDRADRDLLFARLRGEG